MKISLKHFASEVPKTQPHLLEAHHAQKALNCSFNSGSLLATRDGLEVGSMANSPIRGLYTEDGISFYSWQAETLAFKSPVIDDPHHRVYLLQPSTGVFNVTTTLQMAANGPTPTQLWKVGVPAPVSAPVLTLLNRTTLPDYPNTSLSVEAWWESSSKAYGKVTPALTVGTVWQTYWFQPPAKPADAPDGSVLKAKLTIRDMNANKDLATVTMTAGSAARSSAFPGGFEATLEDIGDITIVWGVTATRAYTYVYENEWQEESTNAPPATISPTYIQDVKVGVNIVSFAGYRPGSFVNIYRTYGTGTTYLKTKVTWIPSGDTANPFAIDSSTQPDSVGTAMESADWRPPVTGLQGITLMPGGWFAAFKDNMLYMTEPYRPHAWAYSQSFTKSIRGICPAQGGLVVACADAGYLLNGSAPISATPMTLNLPQPGIAQRSMVSIDGAVAYASNDGLPMVVGASGTMAASQSLFDREKWRERYSSILANASLRLSYFDGMVVGSSNTVADGFVIRLDEDTGSFTRIDQSFDATFLLPENDALYYTQGNRVYRFRASSVYQQFDWWSKDFVLPKPGNFGAGQIECSEPTRVTLYAEGVEVFDQTVPSGYFRINPANKYNRWSIRLRGTGLVKWIHIAKDYRELRSD